MNRKKVVQNTLDKLNNLLGWCRMAFKPAKSGSLALVRGKIRRDVFFDVVEQRIPTVSEEPVKSLGRVFDESLIDKSMRGTRYCRVKWVDRGRVPKISIYGCPLQRNYKAQVAYIRHGVKKPLRAFMTAVGNWGGCDRHKRAKESLA